MLALILSLVTVPIGHCAVFPRNVETEGKQVVRLFLVRGFEHEVTALATVFSDLTSHSVSNDVGLAAFTEAVRAEAERRNPEFAALLYLTAAGAVADMSILPYRMRIEEAQRLTSMITAIRDQVPAVLELAALERLHDFWANDTMEAPNWTQRRAENTDAWLHCWARLALSSDSIDGENPNPRKVARSYKLAPDSIGLAGVSPASLPEGPAKVKYIRDLEVLRNSIQQEQIDADMLDDTKTCVLKTESFIVDSYSKPPFASVSLVNLLSNRLGLDHPAVRRISGKLAEKLPAPERQELEAIIAALPPAAKADDIRAARKLAAEQVKSAVGQPGTLSKAAKREKPISPVASRQAAVPSGPLATTSPGASSRGTLWLLCFTALTVIGGILWRAQARGASRGPK